MASQGPNFPTAATGNTNAIGGGTVVWTNPQNIEAADGAVATRSNPPGGFASSDDLIGTGYGFSVPATATINGVLVEVNYFESGISSVTETIVQLIKNGTPTGNNLSTGAALTTTATTVSYGGPTNLWGATFAPSDINASNFGADVGYFMAGSSGANVDFIRITVFFTVPAPTVTSVSLNNGPASGGASVTITGTNFATTPTSITFGGTAATNVALSNSTTLTCVTPAHAAGVVNVVVTNPDGQTGTGTNVYTFNPAPTVSGCAPNNGTQGGGTPVTISGSNFLATPTSITFGGTAATNIAFVNSGSVTCTTPAHAAGTVSVVVTNPDGQTGTGSNVFTFNPPPSVSSCTPPAGSTAGGTSVTVNGSNFLATPSSITFGGTAATGISFVSSSAVSCVTPAHAAGAVNVTVTDPDGQVTTGSNVFTFNTAPTFGNCSPPSGPIAGGTNVTISGSNFVGTTGVTFGGVAATNVTLVNSTTVTCTTPAHASGTVNVVVTDSDSQTATGVNGFSYTASSRFLAF